jgi:hypothetical protein
VTLHDSSEVGTTLALYECTGAAMNVAPTKDEGQKIVIDFPAAFL